jgi:hypothetical protein
MTLMVEPGVLGTPCSPLHVVTMDERERFFAENPYASDQDALDWIADLVG